MGIDLPCGAGRVAALTCRRHVIHYRSRSIPGSNVPYDKGAPQGRLYRMERMMGIEPTLPAWEAEVLPMNYIRIVEVL